MQQITHPLLCRYTPFLDKLHWGEKKTNFMFCHMTCSTKTKYRDWDDPHTDNLWRDLCFVLVFPLMCHLRCHLSENLFSRSPLKSFISPVTFLTWPIHSPLLSYETLKRHCQRKITLSTRLKRVRPMKMKMFPVCMPLHLFPVKYIARENINHFSHFCAEGVTCCEWGMLRRSDNLHLY